MSFVPFAAPDQFVAGLAPEHESADSLWFIMAGDKLLVDSENRLPKQSIVPLEHTLYLGTYQGKNLFAGETLPTVLPEWQWTSIRSLFGVISDAEFSLAGRAMHLMSWTHSQKFCGRCGSPTIASVRERCCECSSCGQLHYPRFSPAVLALVRRDDRILLAQGPVFPFYSILAGFVEPGETLEQCVVREVAEEVGIRVKNVRYCGNQPWPFSQGMMIGFVCDWESGEIKIEPTEIVDARWFDRETLPLLPPSLSLSRILIDDALLLQ